MCVAYVLNAGPDRRTKNFFGFVTRDRAKYLGSVIRVTLQAFEAIFYYTRCMRPENGVKQYCSTHTHTFLLRTSVYQTPTYSLLSKMSLRVLVKPAWVVGIRLRRLAKSQRPRQYYGIQAEK